MKIAFYKAESGNFVDKVIAWWTRPSFFYFWKLGKYSHVEYLFENYYCFSASPRDEKTRWKTIVNIETSGKWDILECKCQLSDEEIKIKFEKINGKSYDWAAILFGFVMQLDTHAKDKWFCSEIGAKLIYKLSDSYKYHPNKFYDYVFSHKSIDSFSLR